MHRVIRSLPAAKSVFFVVILLRLVQSSCAFSQDPTGSLRGIIEDASGARVAGAKIEVQASGRSLVRTVATDDRGEFRVDLLPPGDYRINVNSIGFAPVHSDVAVAVSSVRNLTITMLVASVQQTVTVNRQTSSITAEPIDAASATLQSVVTAKDLETIPLANRSFANIAYLAPGTEPVEPSDPTKARITAVSFGGSSGLNVELSVDGGDNTDDYIGGFRGHQHQARHGHVAR
jgi:predicted phage tail protein